MMTDDSPIKPKPLAPIDARSSGTTSGTTSDFPATPRRSGSFGRSTSSPSLVQTTPTKANAQGAQRFHGQPPAAPFRATNPMPTVSGSTLNALKSFAFAPKSSPPTVSTTTASQSSSSKHHQGAEHSTPQNQQGGANNNSRATTSNVHSGTSSTSRATAPTLNNGNGAIRPAAGTTQAISVGKTTSNNVLRANSLAAAASSMNGSHNISGPVSSSAHDPLNQNSSHSGPGFRPTTNYSTAAQPRNAFGGSNHHQGQSHGTGLKRPFINNGYV